MPSACSSEPPVGSCALRIEDADVVEAEEPAGEDVAAGGSLRLTHQLKFSISPWNERSRKRMSARPSVRSILYRYSVAQACTGGFTSLKFHS